MGFTRGVAAPAELVDDTIAVLNVISKETLVLAVEMLELTAASAAGDAAGIAA